MPKKEILRGKLVEYILDELLIVKKDLGTFSKCQQIYIKLTGFEDNDSGKLPFKYY